ncbi:MAG: thiamine pyrophosphate-dependent dehydrogenase E1 component subunit alpha [Rhodospirillales bacterium]|jgi:pyruvate dehydrogenase E1 component alpha subunit|nr:thiamine pyrophosphate-dependent dehydrogenase E1 component subunit alpha [Rhodospirillales bacterium]
MSSNGPSPDQVRAMHGRMLLIRKMEERLSADFHAGKLPGGVHLYIGQEAVAAGVCAQLTDADKIASTHRGHGHFLAKGGDPKTMMAEVYGRETGICKGMGGSMHVADFSKGIIGANGIVGAGLAITAGAAFAAELDGDGQVAVCFFGDGASNQGVLMETLNVTSLWKLPMVFICEHNGFAEFSPAATVTSGEIADRARPFGMPVQVIDGNDAVAVWTAAADAVAHARGGGPAFIEAKTYRIHGHFEMEVHMLSRPYREEAEIEAWRGRDPIQRLAKHMVEAGIADENEIAEVEARTDAEVEEAAAFAEAGTPAGPGLAPGLMFADAGGGISGGAS